jgi:hypothetical protein
VPLRRRLEALRASGLTDLVGPEGELDVLLRRWNATIVRIALFRLRQCDRIKNSDENQAKET